MSEPLADRLKHFTPEGAALDRDALLFHAGRASVRPARGWKLLAAALAAGQTVTLALLWPHPSPPAGPLIVQPAAAHPEQIVPSSSIDPSEWLVLNRQVSGSPDADLPPPVDAGPL